MGLDRDALLPITEHDQRKVRVPGVFALIDDRFKHLLPGFSDASLRQVHPGQVEVRLPYTRLQVTNPIYLLPGKARTYAYVAYA